jgi:hypothetical protein
LPNKYSNYQQARCARVHQPRPQQHFVNAPEFVHPIKQSHHWILFANARTRFCTLLHRHAVDDQHCASGVKQHHAKHTIVHTYIQNIFRYELCRKQILQTLMDESCGKQGMIFCATAIFGSFHCVIYAYIPAFLGNCSSYDFTMATSAALHRRVCYCVVNDDPL